MRSGQRAARPDPSSPVRASAQERGDAPEATARTIAHTSSVGSPSPAEVLKTGDVVLLKASRAARLERIAETLKSGKA